MIGSIKSKILSIIITALAISVITFHPADSAGRKSCEYSIENVFRLRGGFPETAEAKAESTGLKLEDFLKLQKCSASSMLPEELKKLNEIRESQIKPSPAVLMQKVVPSGDIGRYISGEKKVKGFLSVCADTAGYRTVNDFYYGLRLDYPGSKYSHGMKSIGIIRFKAKNASKCIIPRSRGFGGDFSDPYPFGGHGFTTGTNGRLGTPEWVLQEPADLYDGAAIFELWSDGEETLRAIFRNGKFDRVTGNIR